MGYTRISKVSFYLRGGLSNPRLHRFQRGSGWCYYQHF